MDLRHLRHFRQIAQSGSFLAASSILNIAQPALSRQMLSLEQELGTRLFHRTGRGVVLTEAGQTLLLDANRLLDDAEVIFRRMRGFGEKLFGEATIGLSPTIGRLLTLPLALRVRSDFPNLRLRISEGFSGTLLEWLQTGRLDAAILYHVPASGSLRSEIIAQEPLSIIGGFENEAFPAEEAVSIKSLSGKSLVLPTPSHGLRQMIDAHAAKAGVRLDLLFEFDSLDSIIAMVRQGIAMTILPESAVRAELECQSLRSWRISNDELVRPLVITTAPQRANAIGRVELAELLREAILSAALGCGWQVM